MVRILEVYLAIVIVIAFVPVFITLDADYSIGQMLIELLLRIFG